LSHDDHIVGGPTATVTPCFCIDSSASTGSKRSISSVEAPTERDEDSTELRPMMWLSGATPRVTSSARTRSSAEAFCCSMFTDSAAWLRMAGLGDPAVPDVKASTAGASPSSSTRSVGSHSISFSKVVPPSGVNPHPMTNSTSSRAPSVLAVTNARADGPAISARACTASSSSFTASAGVVGSIGTATMPAPTTAR
jgi:hypothetical protein